MEIFIPTRGRVDNQKTLRNLPKSWMDRTFLVVSYNDYEEHKTEYKEVRAKYGCLLVVTPKEVDGIARTREYIGRRLAKDKFVMIDDDIYNFHHRKNGDHKHLYINKRSKTKKLLQYIEKLLDIYAHVGVTGRANNNAIVEDYRECARYIRVLAFRKRQFCSCTHGRVPVMEDFDIALQLLRKGYKSCVIYKYAQGQSQTQSKGGCADYRTHELQKEAAFKLKELHPQFVRVKIKNNRTGGEFGKRYDVTISWLEAYQSSQGNAFFRKG